jgi:hypothetical protein
MSFVFSSVIRPPLTPARPVRSSRRLEDKHPGAFSSTVTLHSAEAERVISTTECHYLYRTSKRQRSRTAAVASAETDHIARRRPVGGSETTEIRDRARSVFAAARLSGEARRSIRRLMLTGLRLRRRDHMRQKALFFFGPVRARLRPMQASASRPYIRRYTLLYAAAMPKRLWNFRIGDGDLLERELGQAIALTSSAAG